tara:strand:- start:18 stop:230 length:213 start_codon:yes stop_codon:yes gene_type:complete
MAVTSPTISWPGVKGKEVTADRYLLPVEDKTARSDPQIPLMRGCILVHFCEGNGFWGKSVRESGEANPVI